MSPYHFNTDFEPVSLKDTELFQPITVGSAHLQHRVVLSPLTRFRNVHHVPKTHLLAEYYGQRSQRPGTLLITEATFISAAAAGYDSAPGIYSEEQVEAWSKVYERIHGNNSFGFQQLWALGRSALANSLASAGQKYVSASDVYADEEGRKLAIESNNPLVPLTIPEIKEYVANYVKAARNALRAGADGVEIHSANGYLPNQFIDPKSNKRTDEYGGSITNRSRFTLEIVDALVEAIGADKVGIRFSPHGEYGGMSGFDRELVKTYEYLYNELEKRAQKGNRLAYIHLVEPRVPSNNTELTEDQLQEGQTNENVYQFWNGVVIRAGDYGVHPDILKRDISNGRTLVAFGRYFIANPDLPDRLAEGWKLTKYNRDSFYLPDAEGYTDYPFYKDQISTSA